MLKGNTQMLTSIDEEIPKQQLSQSSKMMFRETAGGMSMQTIPENKFNTTGIFKS
jgi:hypothetical protein